MSKTSYVNQHAGVKRGRPPKKVAKHIIEKEGIEVGRDKKVIHPDEVRKLAALGCSKTDICNYLGIKKDAFTWLFTDAYIQGYEELKITLRRSMLNNACQNNNASVQIFLAKNYLNMSDQPKDNEDNKPLPWNSEE